jgi:Uma2 family endonuclease
MGRNTECKAMSESVLDTVAGAAVPSEPIWRLSVEQYHAMIEAGILTDDDPVELLEGWLVFKMPKNPPHRITTRLLRAALEQLIPVGWYVDSQEPEPDVIVVRGDTRDYLDRHPGAADLAIVIEVADTTLQRDRTTKKRSYARAGVGIYWIVNLSEQQIESYTQPIAATAAYQTSTDYRLQDSIPVLIAGVEVGRIAVESVLP